MKHYLIFLLFCFGVHAVSAQQLQPALLAVDGGTATIGNMQMDWTLGEIAVASYTGRPQSFTEGFHQPMIRIEKVYETTGTTSYHAERSPKEDISVFPNPASDQLIIQLPEASSGEWKINVWNSNGNMLYTGKAVAGTPSLELYIHGYPMGLFIVQIILPSPDMRAIYKITKI